MKPDFDDEDVHSPTGGYLFTALADAPTLTLTEPLVVRSTTIKLSIPPDRIAAGQIYLLGTPTSPTFEVVQIDDAPATPGRPRSIRRARFGTVVLAHPIGTPVTPITVERIDDWDQWNQRADEP